MANLKSTKVYGILNMLYNKITNVATPTDDNDAANKEYVDNHTPHIIVSAEEANINQMENGDVWIKYKDD